MQLGVFTFADINPDSNPEQVSARLRDLLAEAELADQLGLDVFAVGEHHRRDYAVAAPAVVLAAIAARTKRIRLSSAVTVLSSDDPVRVFQEFATVDLLSSGRAEIMAGRGSFIESFPLFGFDLEDYDELFTEKLELLLAVREKDRVTWAGKHRAPLADQLIYPRPVQGRIPIWIAVGGTPNSAVRAARLGLPMALAIIGGEPARFAPIVELYRTHAAATGHKLPDTAVSINSHVYVANSSEAAADEFFPHYAEVMTRIGRERGWPGMTRQQFDIARSSRGALLVGSPEEVTEKILAQHEIFRHDRFLAQIPVGTIPHAQVMKAIELYGTRVAPAVRKATAS